MAVAAVPQIGGEEDKTKLGYPTFLAETEVRSKFISGLTRKLLRICWKPWIKPGTLNDVLTYIALLVIAIGTGGIKPCVSSLGGDQFADNEVGREQVAGFFSLFYASINAGSLLSTFISPILREEVECFDREDCFFIAFLIPAILMFVAILAFLFGKSYYITNKPSGNIFVSFCGATWAGLRGKCKSKEEKEHFLDHAIDAGHPPGIVQDIKIGAQNIDCHSLHGH